jgi:anti-sigma factor RsiW
MNQSASHLSTDDLLSCLDGRLPEGQAEAVRGHLASCERCRRALASMRELDALARSAPPERAGDALVRSIMVRVGITPRQSAFVRAVGALPYVFAMLVVGGVIVAVFAWTGAFTSTQVTAVPGAAADAYAAAESGLTAAAGSIAGLVSRVLPAPSGSGLRLWIGLGLVLMAVAALDRIFASRVLQRPR